MIGAGPATIYLIRHGEKPPLTGPPAGIDENGVPHEHSLIVRGWQRAGALAPYFAAGTVGPVPTHLFAPPRHGDAGDHGRPFETLMPLAAKLGVTIVTTFTLDRERELAAAIEAVDGIVLVAWEHKRIPRIATALLGGAAVPDWPDDRFDMTWVLARDTTANARTFRQVPQGVLAGDRADVFPPA